MDPGTIGALKEVGFFGLALFALVGGFRGWYIWRWTHDLIVDGLQRQLNSETARADKYENLAWRFADTTERAANVAARAVARTPGLGEPTEGGG